MFKKKNKQEYHLKEIDRGVDKLNLWFIINTFATIVTGLAAILIAIFAYFK